MTTPILTTKLYIPPVRPELVSRPRLIERLNAGLHRKLTLISAPAGFGKTTLLSEWISSCDCPVVWVSLDKGDNDPMRFWAYVIAALQTMEAGIGENVLSAFQSPGAVQANEFALTTPPLIESVLTALINEIAAIPDPFALVFDDYHVIKARPVHDALAFLLDHLPPQMHLVIATRSDPRLPIARLRGRGQLTELRLTDLRFTSDEATEFLNRGIGLGLSADDVAVLTSRTEGWIAGLQMAAISVQGREDSASFIAAFRGSDRYILDYLVEEVLQRQPDDVQTFLLQTSILDRLTGSLCDAITEQDNGQSALEMLERANLFIVPLDNERRWYRYHRLFTDLLRQRLQQAQPDQIPILHHRASDWYEQNGLMAAAIDHALSAGDLEWAAYLIEQDAEATLMSSQVTTLLSWVDALPDEMVRARPSLCVFHAWALLLTGRPIDDVEARLQDAGSDTDLSLGKATALRAFIAIFRGQIPHAAELSRDALKLLPEDDSFLRGIAAWNLSISHLVEGDVATSLQILDETARTSKKTGNVMIAVMTLCNLAELYIKRGQLHKAQAVYQQALELATDRQGQPLPIAGLALIGLGELSREWNDLETAMRYLTEGIECIGQWGEIGALDGYISLAYIRQAQGDVDGAQEALQKAWQLAVKFDATELDDIMVAAHQAHLWMTQGDSDPSRLEAVRRWLDEQGLTADVALSELEERAKDAPSFSRRRRTRAYTALVRLLIVQRQFDQALAILASLLAITERWGLHGYVIGHLVLKALAFHAQGDVAQAMNALERALSLAEPEGYVRVFVDEGEPMATLLRQAATRGIATEYVSKLLVAFGEREYGDMGAKHPHTPELTEPLIEPLSERELDVLRLLNTHLSSTEIAKEFYISANTVRYHIKSIYGKLNVHRRSDAVDRAKELGLL